MVNEAILRHGRWHFVDVRREQPSRRDCRSIPATGLISGSIAPCAWRETPYETIVTATAGQFSRAARIYWYVSSGISITFDYSNMRYFEGESASVPVSATNVFDLPVTFTVTNLPPGISFDANTSTINGTISPARPRTGRTA